MNRRSWFWHVSTIAGFALALSFSSSRTNLSYASETAIEVFPGSGADLVATESDLADNQDSAGTYYTAAAAAAAGEDFDEDPWEGFNEKMFWFNREVLDRY
ncbi:MAG: hypothetical protein ACREQO_05510, partial [Candidatus Binatia bacterium]